MKSNHLPSCCPCGKDGPALRLKENVIVGQLVPAGTGLRRYRDIVVGSKKELEALQAAVSGTARKTAGDGSSGDGSTVEAGV